MIVFKHYDIKQDITLQINFCETGLYLAIESSDIHESMALIIEEECDVDDLIDYLKTYKNK